MADSVQPHGQTKNVPPSPAGTMKWKYWLAARKPTTYPKLRETPTSSCMSVDKERESRKFSPDASGTHTMQPYRTSTHRLRPPRSFNLDRLLQSRRTRKHKGEAPYWVPCQPLCGLQRKHSTHETQKQTPRSVHGYERNLPGLFYRVPRDTICPIQRLDVFSGLYVGHLDAAPVLHILKQNGTNRRTDTRTNTATNQHKIGRDTHTHNPRHYSRQTHTTAGNYSTHKP
ncbi:Hypothetical predicted protein [Pelobates cultripes]|uniref:Uncharacterized protein n=1 Tax=Pelobates cultripes TaxID=61616 RepID=A0AAD1W268_PELCU|nr:Hypothetical predicted protein [Pelobates cultripes]